VHPRVSPSNPIPVAIVSVVIPTYNRRALLLPAVDSVRAQTFGDWELIVADDGSTDGSADAVEALGDPRVRLLRLPHTGNVAAVRNAGVAASRGEWLAFLDSDDAWLPRRLELQLAAIGDTNAQWSYAGVELMDPAGRPVPMRAGTYRAMSGRIVREVLTGEAAVSIGTLLVRRALLDEVGGFDESMLLRQDYDLALRLATRAEAVAVPQTLARVREHPARMTASTDLPHEQTLRVYERFLQRERDPALRRVAMEQCARVLLEGAVYESVQGQTRHAFGMLRRSLAYAPPPVRWARAAASVTLRTLGLRR
jgi:glycosyltransferase involved in cell wall biosynthesis